MNKVQKERLLKLYNHMRQPQSKLAHKEFNFACINKTPNVVDHSNTCGTMGCMMGEFPAIFPETWRWMGDNITLVKDDGGWGCDSHIGHLFGLKISEVDHLFYPQSQLSSIDPYYNDHPELDDAATRQQVVANLRRFLKIKGVL